MKLIERCARCKSIWVCWNWCSDGKIALHECWNCAASWTTETLITNGVPYWMLRYIGVHLVDHELFEKNLAADMSAMQEWFDSDSWDDNTQKH